MKLRQVMEDILMSDSAKSRKFNVVFDWFDQGQDGYLTHDDFQQMAALFTALPGGDAPRAIVKVASW